MPVLFSPWEVTVTQHFSVPATRTALAKRGSGLSLVPLCVPVPGLAVAVPLPEPAAEEGCLPAVGYPLPGGSSAVPAGARWTSACGVGTPNLPGCSPRSLQIRPEIAVPSRSLLGLTAPEGFCVSLHVPRPLRASEAGVMEISSFLFPSEVSLTKLHIS